MSRSSPKINHPETHGNMQMVWQQLQEGFVYCIDFFIYLGEGYKQFNINFVMKGKEKCFLFS